MFFFLNNLFLQSKNNNNKYSKTENKKKTKKKQHNLITAMDYIKIDNGLGNAQASEIHLLPCKIMDTTECRVKAFFSNTIIRPENPTPEQSNENFESNKL